MIIKFMRELKEKVGQNLFKEIISMAEKDIKFNKVNYSKRFYIYLSKVLQRTNNIMRGEYINEKYKT